jgi:hypothetical protein
MTTNNATHQNTKMLLGQRECRTYNLVSTDIRALVAHLGAGKNCKTMGFSIQFAANHQTGEVIEIVKSGYLCQRDIRPLVEAGFTEWFYSWAFSGKEFVLPDGRQVALRGVVDLMKTADVIAWWRALGMAS